MSMLITVSGPDGSGKSTQIEALRRHFEEQGLSCASQWYRPGYSPLLDALRAQVRKLRPQALPSDASKRADIFKRPKVRRAWLVSALADSSLHYLGTLRWKLRQHDVVIADRFLADAQMDLELVFPEYRHTTQHAIRVIRLAAPRPAIELLYMLPLSEAQARCDAKNEPFSDRPEIRLARHLRYEDLSALSSMTVIDAMQSIEQVHHDTLDAVVRAGVLLDAD